VIGRESLTAARDRRYAALQEFPATAHQLSGGTRDTDPIRGGTPMTRALIVVDVQNDFLRGRQPEVLGGAGVANAITAHMSAHRDDYRHLLATQDHHISPRGHFSDDRTSSDHAALREHQVGLPNGVEFTRDWTPA
jgi:hypothetical protein